MKTIKELEVLKLLSEFSKETKNIQRDFDDISFEYANKIIKLFSIDSLSGSLSDLDGKTVPVKFNVSKYKPNIIINDDSKPKIKNE